MGESDGTRIVRVSRSELTHFEAFARKDAAQSRPHAREAPQAFVAGLHASVEAFDFLSSDCHWLLAAESGGQFIGYLTAVRVHKTDSRVAVLYVDEFMVLEEHRRRGVATALWTEVQRIAQEIGAWRIRLTVDPGNDGARAFYRSVGLTERPLVMCEQNPRKLPNKPDAGDG